MAPLPGKGGGGGEGGHLDVLYFRLNNVTSYTVTCLQTSFGDKLVHFFCVAKPVNGAFMPGLL